MPPTQQRLTQAVPGFHFLTCEARAPYSETWTARDLNGEPWRIQFAHGFGALNAQELADSLRRLQAPQHPVLLQPDLLQQDVARVVLGSETAGNSVLRYFERQRACGHVGLPRAELLDWLSAAAETIDTLQERHNLQHLQLNPGNLLLDAEGRLRLADYGLAQLLWHRAGKCVANLNRRYSAPELFDKQLTPFCDQFSLAVIFVEMLTGHPPFPGQSQRCRQATGDTWTPNLEAVTPADRSILTRALHGNPKRRFPTCTEFVQALRQAAVAPVALPQEKRVVLPAVLRFNPGEAQQATADPLLSSGVVIQKLLGRAASTTDADEGSKLRYVLEPGRLLRHQCLVRWPAGLARLKLQQFSEQWNAPVVQEDAHRLVFHVPTAATFWQRWRGQQPGLQVEVLLRSCMCPGDSLREVTVRITPLFGVGQQADQLLEHGAPEVLKSLRTFLYPVPERRARDRVPFGQSLAVIPVQGGQQLGSAIACHARDLSPTGIGLLLPHKLETPQIYIQTPCLAEAPSLAVLGRIVRVQAHEDGWFEAGATFAARDVEATTSSTKGDQ